jgi:hypothetical protein
MPKLCSEGGRVAGGFSPLFVRVYPNFYEVLFSIAVDSKHVYINSYARVCVSKHASVYIKVPVAYPEFFFFLGGGGV